MSTFGKKQKFFQFVPKKYISRTRKKLIRFLLELCKVQDLQFDEELDKYLFLSKKDLEIKIKMNEMYFVQSILNQYLSRITSRQDDPLIETMDSLGNVPQQLSKEEDYEIELNMLESLNLHSKLNTNETKKIYNETIFMMVSLFEDFKKTTSKEKLRHGNLIQSLKLFERQLHQQETEYDDFPEKKIRRARKIIGNLTRLYRDGKISKKKNYTKFRKDVSLYFENQTVIQQQVTLAIQILSSVKKNLKKYKTYLSEQLKTFIGYQDSFLESEREKLKPKDNKKRKEKDKAAVIKLDFFDFEKRGIITKFEFEDVQKNEVYFLLTRSENEEEFELSLHTNKQPNPIYEKTISIEQLIKKKNESDFQYKFGQNLSLSTSLLLELLKEI